MAQRVPLKVELPDEVVTTLSREEMAAKAKEALVRELLLREHQVSQGKAAELLAITRPKLFDLMSKYQVPAIKPILDEIIAAGRYSARHCTQHSLTT